VRVFDQETGFLVFQKIFNNLQSNDCPLVIWQYDPSEDKRYINESRLNSYSLESKLMHLSFFKSSKLQKVLPLYCYSEEGQIIFKTSIHEIKEGYFSLTLPKEIKVLEDLERDDLHVKIGINLNADYMRVKRLNFGTPEIPYGGHMRLKSMAQRSKRDQEFLNEEFGILSVDEEDKLFASQRETPRARPKVEKWVRIKIEGSEEILNLKLFDLSQGGMAFVALDEKIFPKGITIYLMGIDSRELDDPLVGKIMSHRPIDELQIEWKIGVKFEEGQN
jgi:hypothetical protein